jgi:hypothetical protein
MAEALPPHVHGWTIPAANNSTELSVARGGTPWGPMYQAGAMQPDLSKIDPEMARAWIVDGDERRGMAFMSFELRGGPHYQFRVAGALLHFCVRHDGPEGTGYIPANGFLYVPRDVGERLPRQTRRILHDLGVTELYLGGEMVGEPEHIAQITSQLFPEFADAVELPREPWPDEAATADPQVVQPPAA